MLDTDLTALYKKLEAIATAKQLLQVGLHVGIERASPRMQAYYAQRLLRELTHAKESPLDVWLEALGSLDRETALEALGEALEHAHGMRSVGGKNFYIALAEYCLQQLQESSEPSYMVRLAPDASIVVLAFNVENNDIHQVFIALNEDQMTTIRSAKRFDRSVIAARLVADELAKRKKESTDAKEKPSS